MYWYVQCNLVVVYTVQNVFLTDIDECQIFPDLCDQYCINTDGSYICDCKIGYELSENGRDCISKENNQAVWYYIYT